MRVHGSIVDRLPLPALLREQSDVRRIERKRKKHVAACVHPVGRQLHWFINLFFFPLVWTDDARGGDDSGRCNHAIRALAHMSALCSDTLFFSFFSFRHLQLVMRCLLSPRSRSLMGAAYRLLLCLVVPHERRLKAVHTGGGGWTRGATGGISNNGSPLLGPGQVTTLPFCVTPSRTVINHCSPGPPPRVGEKSRRISIAWRRRRRTLKLRRSVGTGFAYPGTFYFY